MCRIFILTIFIFFILGQVLFVQAQNVVIQVYDPQNLVLKSNSLLSVNFSRLENNLSQTIRKELRDYYASLLYRSGPVLTKPAQTESKKPAEASSSREVFKLLYNEPGVDEKAALRQEWAEAFGIDVWSPYYKYKEIEKLIKKKLSVKVFKLKGEPRVERGKILYVFAAIF
jgi:hypothetical protein